MFIHDAWLRLAESRPELINLLARPDKCLLAISIESRSVNVSSAEKNNARGQSARHFQLTDANERRREHEQQDGNLMHARYVHRRLTLTVYTNIIIYARVVCTMLKPAAYWSISAGWRLLIHILSYSYEAIRRYFLSNCMEKTRDAFYKLVLHSVINFLCAEL